jgi:small subunit ribosomal protein S10
MATATKKTTKKESKKNAPAKIRIKIQAFDHKIVDSATKKIIETAERTGAIISGPIPLPTHKKKVTVNRSTFVNKSAREQFEVNTHKRLIDIVEATPNTITSLSNLSLPAGVDVEIKAM